jgi:hypothetical protein
LQLHSGLPQTFVVPGLTGQIGEQVTQMCVSVTEPAGLFVEALQHLQHGQRDQLGIG